MHNAYSVPRKDSQWVRIWQLSAKWPDAIKCGGNIPIIKTLRPIGTRKILYNHHLIASINILNPCILLSILDGNYCKKSDDLNQRLWRFKEKWWEMSIYLYSNPSPCLHICKLKMKNSSATTFGPIKHPLCSLSFVTLYISPLDHVSLLKYN